MGVVILGFLLSTCAVQRGGSLCEEQVKVVDLKGLDGCGLLLESQNGERLLPINDQTYHFKAGDQLSVSYEVAEGMSICMTEKNLVRLTCVQYLPSVTCDPIDEVESDSWVRTLVKTERPNRVTRYQVREAYIYEVRTGDVGQWYDCQGRMICELSDECQFDQLQLKGKVMIYNAHR